MFNSSKAKGTSKMTHEIINNQPVINIISDGTVITGRIVTGNDFRVSGKIEGELDVKGKCIITQSGHVSGDLKAHDADISGKTDGKVIVGNKLYLRQTAHVTGDIYTKILLIEEGAIFEGQCHMSKDPLKNKQDSKETQSRPKLEAVPNKNGKEAAYKPGFKLDQARS